MDWLLMSQGAIAKVRAWAAENNYPAFELGTPHYRLSCDYLVLAISYEVTYWPEGAEAAIATFKLAVPMWEVG